MFSRDENGKINYRILTKEITFWAFEEIKKQNHKIGILLCEGDENSVDKAVYEIVYSDLLVVPVGGFVDVKRLLPRIKQTLSLLDMYAYAIIDRDALSKKEKTELYKNKGIYTTKLPFIENIICSPEVIEYICEREGLDYQVVIEIIRTELMKNLWQKLKEALPINLGIEKNEPITYLQIGASTKKKTIEKTVSKFNILYSYRDKIIVSIVASHIGVKGRKEYYRYIIDMINDVKYRDNLARTFASFLPKLELYDLNKV